MALPGGQHYRQPGGDSEKRSIWDLVTSHKTPVGGMRGRTGILRVLMPPSW